MNTNVEELIFTRHEAVNLQNGKWPQVIEVGLEFLRGADRHFLSIGPNYLMFCLSNGSATYTIKGWNPERHALRCVLAESDGPRES